MYQYFVKWSRKICYDQIVAFLYNSLNGMINSFWRTSYDTNPRCSVGPFRGMSRGKQEEKRGQNYFAKASLKRICPLFFCHYRRQWLLRSIGSISTRRRRSVCRRGYADQPGARVENLPHLENAGMSRKLSVRCPPFHKDLQFKADLAEKTVVELLREKVIEILQSP